MKNLFTLGLILFTVALFAQDKVITKNGNSYVLGNSISIGDTLVFTVSIASVIKLNLKYV